MKRFWLHALVIFFYLSFFNNILAMVESSSPLIVILDGPTCSGKTSLSSCFSDNVEKKYGKEFEYIAVDDIADDGNCDENDLHLATIQKIRDSISNGSRFILCDTVIDDFSWYYLFLRELKQYKIFYVFVHCPLKILIQRLTQRNFRAHSSGDLLNLRRYVDLIYAFGRMYCRSNQDCGLGGISSQDFDTIVQSIPKKRITPDDWIQFSRRYDVLNIKQDESFFLTLNIPHDLIVHNYPSPDECKYFDPNASDQSQMQAVVNNRCVLQIFSALGF